jgi:hypothetical protein
MNSARRTATETGALLIVATLAAPAAAARTVQPYSLHLHPPGRIASPIHAQAATTTTEVIPFDTYIVACNGDLIHLSGSLLAVSHVTETPSGGFVGSFQFNPQGVTGVDLVTGTTFHATGLTRDISIVTPAGGFTDTFVNRFHIQATSGDESFIVTQNAHVTITPDGNVTASVDNFSASC